jgi:hypothetical protein
MKKAVSIIASCIVALSLSACQKKKAEAVPQKYVGTWRTDFRGDPRHLVLRADGSFATYIINPENGTGVALGTWSVRDNKLVLHYDGEPSWLHLFEEDAQDITEEKPGEFTLVNRSGVKRKFVREPARAPVSHRL